MNKWLLWLMALVTPLMLLLQVTQAYEYRKLANELRRRETLIEQLQEKNRQLRIARAVLDSPQRIDRLAQELGLEVADSRHAVKIRLSGRGGGHE